MQKSKKIKTVFDFYRVFVTYTWIMVFLVLLIDYLLKPNPIAKSFFEVFVFSSVFALMSSGLYIFVMWVLNFRTFSKYFFSAEISKTISVDEHGKNAIILALERLRFIKCSEQCSERSQLSEQIFKLVIKEDDFYSFIIIFDQNKGNATITLLNYWDEGNSYNYDIKGSTFMLLKKIEMYSKVNLLLD